MRLLSYACLIILLVVSSCKNDSYNEEGLIRIELEPKSPTEEIRGVRWSPKGEKLVLEATDKGLVTEITLGLEDIAPIALRLSKQNDSEHYNQLELDMNRDGEFQGSEDSIFLCEPNERRGKFWSSFSGEVPVPFAKNDFHKSLENPYPLSFWFVEDPSEPEAELVIRYSRRGWMQGQVDSEFGRINVLITESEMDGVFDRIDSWAIAPDSTLQDLFSSKLSKSLDTHNWLGNQAFGVDSVLASGRTIWIKPVDPQITREEEETQADWLAPDRAAKRSGEKAAFLHDYEYGMELAESRKQGVLLDFETTWCGPCKLMDQWVYTADTIVTATKNLVCIKIDGDEHKDLVKKYNVSGYPTLIILKPDGKESKRVSGYQSIANTLKLCNSATL